MASEYLYREIDFYRFSRTSLQVRLHYSVTLAPGYFDSDLDQMEFGKYHSAR